MMPNSEKTMEKVVGLCKNRGFVYLVPKYTAAFPIPGITAR